MLRLSIGFCVPFLLIIVSAKDENAVKTSQGCSVNNYNNNFYAGPQKNVESLLMDIKQQLDELKVQASQLKKCDNGGGT